MDLDDATYILYCVQRWDDIDDEQSVMYLQTRAILYQSR